MELVAQGLCKSFGDQSVVHDVSFTLKAGKTLVLLGTSGSGKTTCLKLVNRLISADAGEVFLEGASIKRFSETDLRRQIGYVIQQVGLFPHLSVGQNIEIVPKLLGWSKRRKKARAMELLEMVGLSTTYYHRMPNQLSGGQQQRVGISRALAADPGLVLLDEPFGALDPVTRFHLQKEFRELPLLRSKTSILVTHDVLEAVSLGNQILLMDEGKVQQVGTAKELIFQPKNPFVRQFFDSHRFELQLSVVKIEVLEGHRLSADHANTGIVVNGSDSIKSVLEIAETSPNDSAILIKGTSSIGWNNRMELLESYYSWVKQWE